MSFVLLTPDTKYNAQQHIAAPRRIFFFLNV